MSPSSQHPSAGPAEPSPARFTNPLARGIAATRPAFLLVTLVACLVGLAVAHGSGVRLDPLTALATVLLALVAHAAGNVINDYHDREADRLNTGRLFPFTGGSRFIQNGVLSEAEFTAAQQAAEDLGAAQRDLRRGAGRVAGEHAGAAVGQVQGKLTVGEACRQAQGNAFGEAAAATIGASRGNRSCLHRVSVLTFWCCGGLGYDGWITRPRAGWPLGAPV